MCREQEGSPDDVRSPDGDSFAVPEARDNGAQDAASDETVGTDGDAEQRDAGQGDIVAENVGSQDVTSEDVVTPPPPPDGSCNPPYTCAASAPTGWSGPALLWTATSGSTPPSCPTGYQGLDLNGGLTGTDVGACECSCNLSGEMCAMTATFHPDQACAASTCLLSDGGTDTIRVSPPSNGACTPVPDNLCGSGGSVLTDNVTAYSATCAPSVSATRPTPSWSDSARLCSTACPGSMKSCVIGPTAGFGTTVCIFQSGDIACPSTTYVKKSVYYAGFVDSRSCGACSCSDVDGGTCVNFGTGTPSSMTIYTGSGCTGSSWTDVTLDVCGPYPVGALIPTPASVSYAPVITSGTCPGVSSPPQAQGSVTSTGATTVCCM